MKRLGDGSEEKPRQSALVGQPPRSGARKSASRTRLEDIALKVGRCGCQAASPTLLSERVIAEQPELALCDSDTHGVCAFADGPRRCRARLGELVRERAREDATHRGLPQPMTQRVLVAHGVASRFPARAASSCTNSVRVG